MLLVEAAGCVAWFVFGELDDRGRCRMVFNRERKPDIAYDGQGWGQVVFLSWTSASSSWQARGPLACATITPCTSPLLVKINEINCFETASAALAVISVPANVTVLPYKCKWMGLSLEPNQLSLSTANLSKFCRVGVGFNLEL